MNVTFLIGNGFDLNLGLKTSYRDFIKYYLSIKNTNTIIQKFKNEIKSDLSSWADAELQFGKYTEKFDEGTGGVDFFKCFNDFVSHLWEYLKNEEKRFNATNISPVHRMSFRKGIIEFNQFLSETERSNVNEFLASANGGYEFNFIIFNYTSCFLKFFEKILEFGYKKPNDGTTANRVRNKHHVHGTLKSGMVLGIDNETQISKAAIFENCINFEKDSVIKSLANAMHEMESEKTTIKIIDKSQLFYIYGMSIGETDRIWWRKICECLQRDANTKAIIQVVDQESRAYISQPYHIKKRDVINKFLNYTDYSEDIKQSLKERIHVTKFNIFSGISNMIKN